MAPAKQWFFVARAFDAVRSHQSLGPKVTGRWITSNCLYKLVKIQLANTHLSDIKQEQFNRAMIANPTFNGIITRQANTVGLYRLKFSRDFFYWIGDKPKFPRPPTHAWRRQVEEAEERVFSTRHDAPVAQSNTVPAAEIDEEDETPPDKRSRDDNVSGAQSNATEAAVMDEGEDEDETPAKRLRYEAAVPRVTPAQIQQQTYWDSPEAIIRFCPTEDDESILECLQRRILLLSSVGASVEGWRLEWKPR
jgi:hypothetical protein